MSLNTVTIQGRLGRDPEHRTTQSGASVANLAIATDEKWKNQQGQLQERTTWHDIQVWGQQADFICEKGRKGARVLITGMLQQDKWQDKQTGENRYKTYIKARTCELIDWPDENAAPAPQQQQSGGFQPAAQADPYNDDIPF